MGPNVSNFISTLLKQVLIGQSVCKENTEDHKLAKRFFLDTIYGIYSVSKLE